MVGPTSDIFKVLLRLFLTVTDDKDGVSVGGISVGGGGKVGEGMGVAVSVGGGSGVSVGVGGSVGVSVGEGCGVSVGGGVGDACSRTVWVSWQDNNARQVSPIRQNQTAAR